MELDKEILKITCDLYNNLKFSRSDVQLIIETLQNFVTNVYNPFLLKELIINLHKKVNKQTLEEIESVFETHKNPLEPYSSEIKRFSLYKNKGLYLEPEMIVLQEKCVPKFIENKVFLKTETISMVHLSLKNSLKRILEMEGLLEALLSYMNLVKTEDKAIVNFIQGSLWDNQTKDLNKEGIVLPLVVYYDDVETGNALGSHAGKNELGCVYATIPCLPPNFSSKLESIIVTDIFYSHDRKKYGNEIIFRKLIDELQDLQLNGLVVFVDKKAFRIYFETSLILGDNLGLNGMLGFVESFGLTHFCRICSAGPEHTKTLTREDETLLRSVEEYEKDATTLQVSKTGIKEYCVFNRIERFHVIKNPSVDVMHDLFEGVVNCVMSKILLSLILDQNILSIDYINHILNTMDFGFESSNKPLNISLQYVKTNSRLKMSASESLFFVRYFGIMVGDMVPEDNKTWSLYLKLREIVHILTSPIIMPSYLLQLQNLIHEHHSLYIELFGDLKAKFHLLTHYARLILQNGPVINTSSMRFEAKHRDVKTIVIAIASRKNILKSAGIRLQLTLSHFKFSKYKDMYVTYGTNVRDDSINLDFPKSQSRKCVSNITINDVTYKDGIVLIMDILTNGPAFGKIQKVYVVDNSIYFKYIPFRIIGFSTHYFAFSVIADEITKLIEYDAVAVRTPCLLHKKNSTFYISTRHII